MSYQSDLFPIHLRSISLCYHFWTILVRIDAIFYHYVRNDTIDPNYRCQSISSIQPICFSWTDILFLM